jgi:hypothetical protein
MAGHRFAQQLHLARGGMYEAEQHAHEGRLARTVRTEEAEPDAGGNPQIHPGHGGDPAEPLDEAARDDHGVHVAPSMIATTGAKAAPVLGSHRSR